MASWARAGGFTNRGSGLRRALSTVAIAGVWLPMVAGAQPPAEVPPPPQANAADETPPPPPPPTREPIPPPPVDAVPPPPTAYGQTAAPVAPTPGWRPAPASSPEPASSGVHSHRGFFLRFESGFAWLWATLGDASVPTHASGPGPGFSVAIGGAVTENLILFGDLYFAIAGKVELDDPTGRFSDTQLMVMATGPGLAWYFMPVNVMAALSLSFVDTNLSDRMSFSSRHATGWGVRAQLGKEWWIAGQWGLGIAAQLLWATLENSQHAAVLDLHASLTLN